MPDASRASAAAYRRLPNVRAVGHIARVQQGGEPISFRRSWPIRPTLIPFILIGFAAQLVDGALGMAYRADFQHPADQHGRCRRQPPRPASTPRRHSPPRFRRSATSPTATSTGGCSSGSSSPGVIGRRPRRLCTDRSAGRRGQAGRPRLFDRARPLSFLSRRDASPHREAAQGRLAARA